MACDGRIELREMVLAKRQRVALGRGGFAALLAGPLVLWGTVAAPGPGNVTSPTPAPLSASVVSASTAGDVLSLTIACRNGSSTGICSGPIMLTSHVTSRAGKTIAVASSAEPKTTVSEVAGGSYAVATGKRATLTLSLNSTGQGLLDQFYRLPSTLVVGGTTSITRSVTFSYRRIRSPISFTWAFTRSYTVVQELTITGLPPASADPEVTVVCHSGGCPFAQRAFSPHGGRLALASAFKASHLRPGAAVELEITASNRIGKVAVFTIRSGQSPTLAERCLPPGAPRPTDCA